MFYFFNPETLKIVGASTEKTSMEFPVIEDEAEYSSLENLMAQRTQEDQDSYDNLYNQLLELKANQDTVEICLQKEEYLKRVSDIKEQMKEPNSRAILVVVNL